MNWQDIIAFIPALMSFIGGAGPWSIAVMGVLTGGLLLVARYLIVKSNERVDAGDYARAGANAIDGAVDLRNQADDLRDGMNKAREEMIKEGPPKGEG